MFKDFNNFLNENYIHKFEDSFVTELNKTRNIDVTYDTNIYESVDEANIKIEWNLTMEVGKDGVYSFDFAGVKAVAEIKFILNDDSEEENYETKTFEFNTEQINFEKRSSYNQLLIENVEINVSSESELYMNCELHGDENYSI